MSGRPRLFRCAVPGDPARTLQGVHGSEAGRGRGYKRGFTMALLTKILKPEGLNAENLARLGVKNWERILENDPAVAHSIIDGYQAVLDGLVREGILA
jgi:hypothetical protein